MGKASALNVAELSRDEKLDLLDRLWESLGQDPEALPLTSSQREELDRRLDELEAEGQRAIRAVALRNAGRRTDEAP